MRIAAPITALCAALTSVSALSAADVVGWGSAVVGSQVHKTDGEMRTMDSWSYVDCGGSGW